MGCETLNAGYEDYPAVVWRRGEERNELVGEQIMSKDIGCEDLAERRFIIWAVTSFNIELPRACLGSSGLASGAQLERRVGE